MHFKCIEKKKWLTYNIILSVSDVLIWISPNIPIRYPYFKLENVSTEKLNKAKNTHQSSVDSGIQSQGTWHQNECTYPVGTLIFHEHLVNNT